ncbi:protein ANTI-SILENCING 1-like isoform X2 [Prosopis cineraria]|uniref:protein ANTI-SILENCING 1-like isoform X2 n=1 Tax=Prosopis cineraria TaxID=364024 RepID=UPI002410AA5A|nr:protein ANTI-SILENCING 1-like isoform X2 [Prosopis cineraria]XP_054796578.1 protein ANTI-SILENCING 1-like isoform X2 [Prosopis cineraria]XP_054796579.1 protein ANTI-SILENCING 1-like isoform X2 [Prosopis cineraria]XP_054796580.1 protein ANTI-SILENCING 1-like isoform X2 [Prosopis cineraria]
MTVDDKEENIEFKWGKMKARGGRNKAVIFYESFTYDGVEYSLFDSVYVYKEGEEEPYIGKLIKIWETSDKNKKVKILWFFRPCEILNFLPTNETRNNELFLASGEGLGLVNINPLEALVGKCNVICISKDSRNPQPLDEEVQRAEYVFHRVFDVGHRKVSDKLSDQIAGYDVKCLLNKLDSQKPVDLKELSIEEKEVSGKDMERNEVVVPPSQENIQYMTREENGKFVETLVTKNTESKLGEKPASNGGFGEARKSNVGFSPTINDKSIPMVKANKNEDCDAFLAKKKSSDKKQLALGEGLERQLAKGSNRSKQISDEKIALTSKIGEGGKRVAVGGSVRQEYVKGDGNFTHDTNGLVEDKHGKKTKLGDSKRNMNVKQGDGMQCRRLVHDDDDNDIETLVPNLISSKDKHKLRREKDSSDGEGIPSKRLKLDNKPTKLSHNKLHKESSTRSPNGEQKIDSCECEVTQRPDADKSKWFKGLPWEERMKSAHEQGTLVLLQNLDPSLTSQEVEDVVWHAFQEHCTAKIIQATAFSSPHSGQAFVIFKRREAAEEAIRKLSQSCLLMSNGRKMLSLLHIVLSPIMLNMIWLWIGACWKKELIMHGKNCSSDKVRS